MKILISIWGPEYGCLYREIEIAKELIKQNHAIKFLIHESHIGIIESYFGKESILRSFSWKIIKYKDSNDLDLCGTILNYLKFCFFEAVPDFKKFKRDIYGFKPDIIITDFIPHIMIFSRLMNIKCVSVFNYALAKMEAKLTLWQKLGHWIAFFVFNYLYGLNSLNIIETFGNAEAFGKNVVFVKPIAVAKRDNRETLKKKLGIKNSHTLVFYSLGGSFFNYKNLFLLDKIMGESEEIKIFVLARNREEMIFLMGKLKHILVIDDITPDPARYIYHADLIITKCGFRTVADSLKNRCLLLPIHTPNHPEIFETELLLKKNNLISDVLLDEDAKIIDKIKSALKRKDILLNYNNLKFCDLTMLANSLNKFSENNEY